jgi:hypothetical protein
MNATGPQPTPLAAPTMSQGHQCCTTGCWMSSWGTMKHAPHSPCQFKRRLPGAGAPAGAPLPAASYYCTALPAVSGRLSGSAHATHCTAQALNSLGACAGADGSSRARCRHHRKTCTQLLQLPQSPATAAAAMHGCLICAAAPAPPPALVAAGGAPMPMGLS